MTTKRLTNGNDRAFAPSLKRKPTKKRNFEGNVPAAMASLTKDRH
jgi:hypothetical protein